MHKIIHSDFEIDLTPYGVTTVEDNHWFSDGFFTKYSFPFTLKLEGDLLLAFGDLLDDNNLVNETYFDVKYIQNDKIEPAIFEITDQYGYELEVEFRWGIDEFPNWEKSLRELPLEKFTFPLVLLDPLANHAKTVISQSWPDVNYNFPQVHTDNRKGVIWQNFSGTMNNYDGVDFLENSIEEENGEDVFYNRNYIQPLPYLMYILETGFSDVGYGLKGEILNDELLKNLLLFVDSDYFTLNINTFTGAGSHINNTYVLVMEDNTKYKISGTFYLKEHPVFNTFFRVEVYEVHSVNNSTLYEHFLTPEDYDLIDENGVYKGTFEIIHSHGTSSMDRLSVTTYGSTYNDGPLFEVEITEVFDEVATEAWFKREIDLSTVVPDITFGELITELKKIFLIDFYISGKDVYIDFIDNQIEKAKVVDLTAKEVVPRKIFNSNRSYMIKYRDVDNETYIKNPFFINREGEFNEDLSDENTQTTEIDAFPLPYFYRNQRFAPLAFENDSDKIYFIIYDGVNSSAVNIAKSPVSLELENLHENYMSNFMSLYLNSIPYKWTYVDWIENISEISKKIFAYGKYHVVKSMSKTQVSNDLYEVEIETESLE